VTSIYEAASTTRPRAPRWSCSAARSTAPARRATGRPRAPLLLGVKAVIAESYERIHRSNLIGMGCCRCSSGHASEVTVRAQREDGSELQFQARVRIDTPQEIDYFRHGGILPYVLRQLAA
jgi:aconitate hydratase